MADTFTLPELAYGYDALAPYIDAQTMEIHHSKHHAGYTKKANAALAGTAWEGKSAREILQNLEALPVEIRQAAQNNVGGFCNHAFFWDIMSPDGVKKPTGALADAIGGTFGSVEKCMEKVHDAALKQFGSGWAWLVTKDGQLEVISTANQDSPLSLGYERVLGLDVWEHAYYLKYQNQRAAYVDAWWNVVDWNKAGKHFDASL
jgi:Fe-Mn family superoxide dismutase